MPSAPLFYQPLIEARVRAAPIGETTVHEAHLVQQKLTADNYQQHRPAMDQIMRGFEGLQAQMPGSRPLDIIQFAFDDAGYIANRVVTAMRLHPSLLDTATPDDAARIGAHLVQEATKELAERPGMRAVGDTLEVAPDATHLLRQHWEGRQPLDVDSASWLGMTASRELQRAVTPLEPDTVHPKLQWLEDGTIWNLGMRPGAVSQTLGALGIQADPAAVEATIASWRADFGAGEPKAEPAFRAVGTLLAGAGLAGPDGGALDAAYGALQGAPLDNVPLGLAQALLAHRQLPSDRAAYVAGRIVETGGSQGNIEALLDQLDGMRPAPSPPPPGPPPAPAPSPAPPVPAPPAPAPAPAPPPAPAPAPGPPAPPPPPGPEPAPAPGPAPAPPGDDAPAAPGRPPAPEMTQADMEALLAALAAQAEAAGPPAPAPDRTPQAPGS